jgi:thiamine pyrophosphokinase
VQLDTVIVVAGGGPPHPSAGPLLPPEAPTIAADEGLDYALALGLRVSAAVGDFDSVSPAGLAAAEEAGIVIERHSPEKDSTDLELALDAAAALAPRRILVLGPGDGRLDHLLAGVLELGAEDYEAFELDALLGTAKVHVVRGERQLQGSPGELVSLLPLHGPAEGVVTEGLRYPLQGETLAPGSSRGVSNVFAAPSARVTLERGVLLAIRPGGGGEDAS